MDSPANKLSEIAEFLMRRMGIDRGEAWRLAMEQNPGLCSEAGLSPSNSNFHADSAGFGRTQLGKQPNHFSEEKLMKTFTMAELDQQAERLAFERGITKEAAVVQLLNANPKLYDQYLAANPAQTGGR